jgi:cation transport ATPase
VAIGKCPFQDLFVSDLIKAHEADQLNSIFLDYCREYLKYVALLSVSFGLPPIAIKAIRTLRRFRFDANCLMFFAACGAVALQDFTEAAAVTFLFAFSEWLEVRATTRARDALSAICR